MPLTRVLGSVPVERLLAFRLVRPAPLPVKLFEALLKVSALLYVPLIRPLGTVPLDRLLALMLFNPAPLPVKLFEAFDSVSAFEYVPLNCVDPTEPLI